MIISYQQLSLEPTTSHLHDQEDVPEVTGTVTVDCDAIEAQSGNVFLNIVADQPEVTSAPVFVSTSSNPIIGAWVDGDINLSDGNNTYNSDVTEFDNILPAVEFGTYNFTFTRSGGCSRSHRNCNGRL